MTSRFSRLLQIVSIVFAFTCFVLAQSTGNVQGNVTDSSGAAVPNAKVTIHNMATGVDRVVTTDSDGNYQAASMPLGTYSVTIEAPGMQKQVMNNIELSVGSSVPVNAKLKVGSATETVTINEETPVVETTTQTVSQVIN